MDESSWPGAEEDTFVALPGYQHGGRVERTGIALVHEGEYVVPAPGSEAMVTPGPETGAGLTLHYHFPVEVEVIGRPDEVQSRALAAYVFDQLQTALASQV